MNYGTAIGATAEGAALVTGTTAGSMVAGGAATWTGGSLLVGGAIGGTVGSIAGQLVGNALGVQDGFSWKNVALSALSGGFNSGLNSTGLLQGSGWETTALRQAASSALTQGVGVVTGLQPRFDWKSVAASAAGGAVSGLVGEALQGHTLREGMAGPVVPPAFAELGQFGGGFARGAVSGFAGGAVAAFAQGGRISVQQVATDAFGNALGSSLADVGFSGDTAKKFPAGEYESGLDPLSPNGLGLRFGNLRAIEGIKNQITLSGETELRLQMGLTITDYGDQYEQAGVTSDPSKAVRNQINSDPSAKSLFKSVLNGFVSAGATWMLGGSDPSRISEQDYALWEKANPNPSFGERPMVQITFDIDSFGWKKSIGTTPALDQELINVLSLGVVPVGKGLGAFAGGINVAGDEGLSHDVRSQGAFDAGASAMSVPAALLMAGAPGLRVNRNSVMGPNEGPQLPRGCYELPAAASTRAAAGNMSTANTRKCSPL
ncbi:hypothetical protein SAMN04489708_1881, partial [Paracidovorax cattleyae]